MTRLMWMLRRIWRVLAHPLADRCYVEECSFCATLDCPNGAYEHYWHDGCPACWSLNTNNYRTDYEHRS